MAGLLYLSAKRIYNEGQMIDLQRWMKRQYETPEKNEYLQAAPIPISTEVK